MTKRVTPVSVTEFMTVLTHRLRQRIPCGRASALFWRQYLRATRPPFGSYDHAILTPRMLSRRSFLANAFSLRALL